MKRVNVKYYYKQCVINMGSDHEKGLWRVSTCNYVAENSYK